MSDFYEMLYESISNEEIINKKVCLITNEILNDTNSIKLYCGHEFVYDALFEEIKMLKNNKTKIKVNEIQCPYCRNIQKGILPYRENYPKILYVNYPLKYAMFTMKCKYINKKGIICGKQSITEYCKKCEKQIQKNKETIMCEAILKSGKRKGLQCGNSCKTNKYCGKHLKMFKDNIV